jgi:large subunit ribosomal protein L32
MAHPKRKHSHSRTRLRRTHQKVEAPTLTICQQCKTAKPAYVVCPTCGFYKGKQVLEIKVKQEKGQA